MAYGKKMDSKGGKPMSPKEKKLAAMSGDKGKITRGDVIKAAQMKKGGNMKGKKK